MEVTNSYNETMAYDANGNIQMLQRTGEYDDQVQSLQIDNLEYFYHPTKKNQLMKVTDAANNPNGFKDDSDGTNDVADDYTYDEFGNMNRDANKGILIVYYNHLNLPTTVEFANGKIEYIYNAAGVKLQKKVYEGSLITITDYLNGFQYVKTGSDDPRLEFFPHAEGYVKVTESVLFNYVYNYTDHLGNVRVSYGLDPATNVLTILEENHYYPFGLKHANYNMTSRQYERDIIGGGVIISPVDKNAYKYKLNGKEFQDELGLNMYAMDLRQYDPAIGRWVVQDPVIHHNYSPYSAFDNNPVFWSDPSGADSNMPEFFDAMGRNKFDSNGLYITPDDRGEADLGMMEFLREENNMHSRAQNSGSFHKEFTISQFIRMWEENHGIKMTRKQKRQLRRGCIGITNLELSDDGNPANPPLKDAVSSFANAQIMALNLENDIKNNPHKYPPGTRVVIFSKRFWSKDSSKFLPDSHGNVDMTGYNYSARPGYINFDYGLYDKRTNTWWHANHCANCGMGRMKVYQSDLLYYSRPLLDFNRQIFIVTTTTVPPPN